MHDSKRFGLGSFVAFTTDSKLDDIGVIVFDHIVHKMDLYTVRRLHDRHLSTAEHDELKLVPPAEAAVAWGRTAIEYSEHDLSVFLAPPVAPDSVTPIDTAVDALLHVSVELDKWLSVTMRNYNDIQYGKGDLRRLYTSCYSRVLALCAPGKQASLCFFHEPARTWSWSMCEFKDVVLVQAFNGIKPISYSVCTDGTGSAVFLTPQAGVLVLT